MKDLFNQISNGLGGLGGLGDKLNGALGGQQKADAPSGQGMGNALGDMVKSAGGLGGLLGSAALGGLLGTHKQKDAGLRAFADVEREAGAEFVRQRRIDDQKIKTALQKTSPRAGNVRRLYDRREAALRQKRQYVLREFLRSGDKQHTVAAL